MYELSFHQKPSSQGFFCKSVENSASSTRLTFGRSSSIRLLSYWSQKLCFVKRSAFFFELLSLHDNNKKKSVKSSIRPLRSENSLLFKAQDVSAYITWKKMQEYVVMLWNFLLQLLCRINRPHFLRVYRHNKSTWDFRRTLELLVNHSRPVRDLQDFSRILLALRMSLRDNFQQADWLLYFSLIMKMHEMSCRRLTYFKIDPNLTISHRLVI